MTRAAMTLQARIAWHIVTFTALLLATFAFGAWRIVTDVEDVVLDRYLQRTLPAMERGPTTAAWLEELTTAAAVRERLALPEVPQEPGWFTVFTSADGQQARWVRGWRDTAFVWWQGLEVEYRVEVRTHDGRMIWTLIHLEALEYTEAEIPSFQLGVLVFGGLAWVVAVLLSARLARSAMAPVVDLTRRLRDHDAAGEPLAASCAKDEVGMLASALDDALAREREGLERERRFISDCSHELRTPLMISRGALSLLTERTVDDARRAELMARLERSVGRLEGVTHTFLVMAREERTRGARSPLGVAELVREALAEQRLLFPHRQIEVNVSVADDAKVEGQRDVLLVLFRNILCNVFQHSSTTSLEVSWCAQPSLHISFVEGPANDQPASSSSMGYGIGLPLVRRLTNAQGWRFVESRAEAGAPLLTIWFNE
jgi:signal transduction histidine kinase